MFSTHPSRKRSILLVILFCLIPLALSACQPEATWAPYSTEAHQPTPSEPTIEVSTEPVEPEETNELLINGTNLTRLTSTPGDEYHTVWSPDGQWLLFTYNNGGEMSIGTYHFEDQSWALLNATLEGDLYLEWSPDGTQFTFDAYGDDGRSAIYLADFPTDLTNPLSYEKLAIPSPAFMSSISPDGTTVLVYVNNQLQLYDLATESLTPIVNTTSCWHPKFSPDGSQILFTTLDGDNQDIYILALADGSMHKATDSSALFDRAQWSPDGSQIVYVAEMDSHTEIWMTDLQTGLTEYLIGFPDDSDSYVSMPEISPDGQLMVFTYQGDLWLMDLSELN